MWCVIVTTTFGALVIAITLLCLKGRRKRILGNRIPGPVGSFILGNVELFAQGSDSFVENMLKAYRIYEKSLFKVWVLNRLIIIPTKPEDIEKILKNSKCIKKCAEYSVFQETFLGTGIFTNNNIDEWKHNKKLVIKGLAPTKLKSFIPTFYQEATVLAEIMLAKRDLKSKDCDVSHPIEMTTMEMIGKNILGVTLNTHREGQHKFVEAILTVFHICAYRILHPWFMNNMLFYFSPVKREFDRCSKYCSEFVDDIIKSKITKSKQIESLENMITSDDDFHQDSETVIDILLQHSHEMSLKQIREEIVTIIVAGQDTSATAIASVVFMLAHHQDVQNKVFEELQSIFFTDDFHRQPTFEDLQQMNYLERVIKETLRLFPSGPVFGRSIEEDMEIGGHLCPAGATIVIFSMFLHRSPLYYSDPNKFNPDNFLPDACSSRHPFAYIPFSGGLRSCVGNKYAFIQLKTVISTLVRRLKFFPSNRCPKPEDVKIAFPITLKFVDGCHVKIEPRV